MFPNTKGRLCHKNIKIVDSETFVKCSVDQIKQIVASVLFIWKH